MKKLFTIILFFFLSYIGHPAALAQTIVPSQITSVTLFAGQALVKRKASTTVAKGLNELVIEIEAFHVDKDSVTAKIYGSGDIFSVQFRNIPAKESPQQNIRAGTEIRLAPKARRGPGRRDRQRYWNSSAIRWKTI